MKNYVAEYGRPRCEKCEHYIVQMSACGYWREEMTDANWEEDNMVDPGGICDIYKEKT